MNKLPIDKRVTILRLLTEGSSMRSISRVVGVSINTVTKLLVSAGHACARYQHEKMVNLTCERLQLDEIWAFVYAKQANVTEDMLNVTGAGSIWTWIAIDEKTKLIPSWIVGLRDAEYAQAFVCDLASRLRNRVSITTDGLRAYVDAIQTNFGGDVDYAVLHKVYGATRPDEARYSPAECCGAERHRMVGDPDLGRASTSFIERQNLTLRMRSRRFTRLTNGFSKKLENLEHAVALHFMVYNFITRHTTLRMPPALKAGVSDHVWTWEELVEMIDRDEAERKNQETST